MNARTSTLATWLSCGVGMVGVVFIVATSLLLSGCLENDDRPDGGDAGSDAGSDVTSCEVGETRDAGDGCNSCFCEEDGAWACTEMACPPAFECEVDSDCFETGCSGQLCAAEDIASTCEWLPWYGCFGEPVTPCGCVDGFCAWTDQEALNECLDESSML